MGVSRSGYYKWRKRDKSTRDLRREEVIALVSEVHKAHPSYVYRWVAAFIRVNYQQDISDNYTKYVSCLLFLTTTYRQIFESLEAYYNMKRIHSHCNYMSPDELERVYERMHTEAELLAG